MYYKLSSLNLILNRNKLREEARQVFQITCFADLTTSPNSTFDLSTEEQVSERTPSLLDMSKPPISKEHPLFQAIWLFVDKISQRCIKNNFYISAKEIDAASQLFWKYNKQLAPELKTNKEQAIHPTDVHKIVIYVASLYVRTNLSEESISVIAAIQDWASSIYESYLSEYIDIIDPNFMDSQWADLETRVDTDHEKGTTEEERQNIEIRLDSYKE